MLRRYRELWYALVAMVALTAAYLVAYRQAGAFPAAYGLVGHGIGVAGFLLMLMTETLYSIRKQLTDARWGSMAGWLRFHMVTGLVGPYLVLLHTSMRFRGLAGLVMLLTLVVAVSGLVGRYLYTAVPRTIDGIEPVIVPAVALGAAAGGTDPAERMTGQVVETAGVSIAASVGCRSRGRRWRRGVLCTSPSRGSSSSWPSSTSSPPSTTRPCCGEPPPRIRVPRGGPGSRPRPPGGARVDAG